ncbi:MAG: GNAT family N-acetyltransferase [Ruminiclostridium sp.]
MSLSIREAKAEDVVELCSLMEELSGHAISQEGMVNRLNFVANSPFDSLYICEEGKEVLGLLAFRIRENVEEVSKFGEISAIVTDPQKRRKGVGRFMMDFAEKLADEKGCIGTWLVSGFGREEEAHEFYKELGYQINGYRFVKKV